MVPTSITLVYFCKIILNTKIDKNKPDFSERGNNLAKNNCILPQNTVFCDVDKRRNKSMKIKHRVRVIFYQSQFILQSKYILFFISIILSIFNSSQRLFIFFSNRFLSLDFDWLSSMVVYWDILSDVKFLHFYYIDTSVLLENIPLVKFIKTTSETWVVYFP